MGKEASNKLAPQESPTIEDIIDKISKESESLSNALKKEQERSKEYFDRLLRLQADFDNYQKRTKKEMEHIVKLANERLMLKLLDAKDDLERALSAAKKNAEEKKEEEKKAGNLIEGLEIALKNIDKILKEEGVEPVEALGCVVDTTKHEVVETVPMPGQKDYVIVGELRKGYMMHGHVIRTSLVRVIKNPNSKNSKG